MEKLVRRLSRLLLAMFALALAGAAFAETSVIDQYILLGQSAAFTGPPAQLRIQMHAGAKVYFEQVNDLGGVSGRKI